MKLRIFVLINGDPRAKLRFTPLFLTIHLHQLCRSDQARSLTQLAFWAFHVWEATRARLVAELRIGERNLPR
jgi:hypothetical protein